MASAFKIIVLTAFAIYSLTILCSYLSDLDTNNNIFTQIMESSPAFFQKTQEPQRSTASQSSPRINKALTVRTNSKTRPLTNTQSSLTSSLGKISSGLRINRAKDDAAGSAVTTRMDSDNTSLKQAIRNSNDGVSLVQTADGALNQQYNILVRLRELAVQSSNPIYNSGDRDAISDEFVTLTNELDTIANATNFNRQQLLDGTGGSNFTLQVGIHQNTDNHIQIDLSISTQASSLGLTTIDVKTQTTALNAITVIDTALNTISTRRAYFAASQNRLENALNEASNYSENLAASQSQIMDADFAKETSQMTKSQIMQQAGVASLAQAKAIPQSIIALL